MNGYYALLSLCSLALFFYCTIIINIKTIQYSKQYNVLPKNTLSFLKYIFSSKIIKFWFIFLLIIFMVTMINSYEHIVIKLHFVIVSFVQVFLLVLVSYFLGINVGYRFYVNNKNCNFVAYATPILSLLCP